MSQTTETMRVPVSEKPEKRCAIIGTAQTWKQAPWADLSCDILGLNDGFMLGYRRTGVMALPRETIHFDLHPFSQMAFRPMNQRVVDASAIPIGSYLRPEGYLDWLRTRNFPVYVNEVPMGWPAHVKKFPRAAIEQHFRTTYFCSTPAWMLAWALMEGYTTIEIYGIHLATEWEYISQRPAMEVWIERAIQMGAKVVLPTKCPLLKSKHVYAYEPKPDLPLQAVNLQIARVKQDGARLQQQLAACKFYERGRHADLLAQLEVVNLELLDLRQAQARVQTILAA